MPSCPPRESVKRVVHYSRYYTGGTVCEKMQLLQRHLFYNAKKKNTDAQRNLYLAVGSIGLSNEPQNRRH